MNFKRFSTSDNQWYDVPYYQHKTATDTLTLPAVIYPNDTSITVGIKGNAIQNGTPTPQNPVDVLGTGERTGNLFNPNSTRYHMGKGINNRIGTVTNGAMFYIKAASNTNYTIKIHATDSTFVRLYLSNAPIVEKVAESYDVISESETTINPEVTISNTNYTYLWIQAGGTWYTEHGGSSIMLNVGSTALPYEPYGYKIPISSANTTTPVYLGEVQSTRKIGKYVFTGQENIAPYGASATRVGFYFNRSDAILNGRTTGACSHFKPQATPASSMIDGITFGANDQNFYLTFSADSVSTYSLTDIASIKSWLAAQYAAGTPVTVWYVLATETTDIVNEPLMRIGEYADTVSGITIPTITGKDTFDVVTTLKPSEASLNYTGWHDATVQEWDDSQWNE